MYPDVPPALGSDIGRVSDPRATKTMGTEPIASAAGPATDARAELADIISRFFMERSTNLGLTNGIAAAFYSHGVLAGAPLSNGAIVSTIISAADGWDTDNKSRVLFSNTHFAEDVARASRIVLLAAKSRNVSDVLAPSVDVIACIPLVIRFAE